MVTQTLKQINHWIKLFKLGRSFLGIRLFLLPRIFRICWTFFRLWMVFLRFRGDSIVNNKTVIIWITSFIFVLGKIVTWKIKILEIYYVHNTVTLFVNYNRYSAVCTDAAFTTLWMTFWNTGSEVNGLP